MDMHFTRLNESDEFRRQREELRVAELDLIDHVERVAAMRRALPTDTVVDDYELVDVSSGDHVRLSELFSAPDRALVVYHFMYGKAQTDPCPLCTMWIDGYNAVAPHLAPNIDFAVVAAAEPAAIDAHATSRGWSNLRLLSAGDTTFKYDLGSEEPTVPRPNGSRCSPVATTARCGTSTPRARRWPTTDASAASTSSAPSGISSTSRRPGGATGTPR
jgi:predicted dithiol-disulfide oxidoreductase (DUF899 family)